MHLESIQCPVATLYSPSPHLGPHTHSPTFANLIKLNIKGTRLLTKYPGTQTAGCAVLCLPNRARISLVCKQEEFYGSRTHWISCLICPAFVTWGKSLVFRANKRCHCGEWLLLNDTVLLFFNWVMLIKALE